MLRVKRAGSYNDVKRVVSYNDSQDRLLYYMGTTQRIREETRSSTTQTYLSYTCPLCDGGTFCGFRTPTTQVSARV